MMRLLIQSTVASTSAVVYLQIDPLAVVAAEQVSIRIRSTKEIQSQPSTIRGGGGLDLATNQLLTEHLQRNDSSSPLQRNKTRLRLKQRMFRYWQKFNIRVVCRVVCGS